MQQFSRKQHIFGKRDNSLLLGINFRWRKLNQASVSFNYFIFLRIFSCGMVMLTFLNNFICIPVVLCVLIAFIERKVWNFTPQFREIFLWRETALSAHGMKLYKKLSFCHHYAIFGEKNGMCCDWKVCFLISKVIFRFFLLLIVALK